MKKSIICIIIILILGLAMWFYFDGKIKTLEAERDAAIELAISEALELNRSRGVKKEPPVKTKIIYIEKKTTKEASPTKPVSNTFTDNRDGKVYNYIEVEDKLWMADNLNFESEGSWCYEGNADNCKNWGRLYSWKAASEVCPDGWRLPNDKEWRELIWRFGGNEVAGRHLKAGGESNFKVLMAGYRDKKGSYGKVDSSSYFWSETEQDERYASFKGFYKEYANVGLYTYTKPDGFSVRCIKDK